ncbi:hypothetical protein WME73_33125 [Sorangium sp. So ce302]|uniref:hypothetical protein n=1 Tax=unclassified Sorangium TaxID=2621164 RepID=UPI003F61CF65
MQQKQAAMKRQKERARQERQREKDANRLARRKEKGLGDGGSPGEDPDIAGIVPGPQPPITE